MTSTVRPIGRNEQGHVVLLDQTLLPHQEVYRPYETARDVADAITTMIVRGAPAIGITAALGLAMGARQLPPGPGFAEGFEGLCRMMADTRPTAVNLFWAIDRMRAVLARHPGDGAAVLDALDAEAAAIFDEDLAVNYAIGRHGLALVPHGARILTHCNAGALATAGYGTALGVMRAAAAAGKEIAVYADETRPYLQGSRLTAWELAQDGIDVTVIADNAAGHLIARGAIDLAIVGTDRTVANGDVANKIGTYQVAVLCQRHGIPFYVAAPTSTIDLSTPTGDAIPIEERHGDEVRTVFGTPIAPDHVRFANPAFDVTPAELVTGIITERGIARAPYDTSLSALVNRVD
ncbi:MAG: S-methyl-5-thioribose-1-phosphate isomerase [Myxococcota bacterium]|jgi:methylthioribose-1-phosphate isomerase|nr:S-methyl-5-thioribose-1-phosphate isomerase [Myxococcota bacterium]